MPLFQCESCNCTENTALCNYWSNKSHGRPLNCSECDTTIGKWHNMFPKRSASGMLIDQQGYLHSKESVACIPDHYKIVGIVTNATPDSEKP